VAEREPLSHIDLGAARVTAEAAAAHWGLTLEPPFSMAAVSFVAPAGASVVKVAWEGDDESLHEPEALELWNGDGAVRLEDRAGRALLLERARPGSDLAAIGEPESTAITVDLATRLWRPAQAPFRPVMPMVHEWLGQAARERSELAGLALELVAALGTSADWVVHGDLHHHNILRHGTRFVAIDPKPYLADREYEVPAYLWNPIGNRLEDRALVERRIAAFVAAGLSDFRIRAWTVIRGAYLRPGFAEPIRSLVSSYL
jgi:streptomycin 6-kinase